MPLHQNCTSHEHTLIDELMHRIRFKKQPGLPLKLPLVNADTNKNTETRTNITVSNQYTAFAR